MLAIIVSVRYYNNKTPQKVLEDTFTRSEEMKKSYICAILAAVLLLGCLSGCKTPAEPTDPTEPATPSTPSEPTDPSEPEDEIMSSERVNYIPHAFTLNLYDAATNTYSFVWNTDEVALAPVVQLCEGETFDAKTAVNYSAIQEDMVGESSGEVHTTHVCKVRIPLEAGKTYSYRIYDTRAKIGSTSYTFTARDPRKESFTFVHLTDSQVTDFSVNSGIPLNMILRRLEQWETPPEFLLHTGDVVQYGISEKIWRYMLETSEKQLSNMPFVTVGGNHEMVGYGGSQYDILKHFDALMPEQDTAKGYYFSFDYGDVRFIQLNTNEAFGASKKLSDAQYNWLVEQLETNDKKWTIVSMHHALYSVGSWGNNPAEVSITKGLRAQLSDLFAQYGVDLVLQGHDHTNSYTYPIAEGCVALKNTATEGDYFVNPDGVVYGMVGPAGNQEHDPWETYEDFYKFAGRGYTSSWQEVTVEEDRITVTIKCIKNGAEETVTTYGIIKN